ncbi:MAG: hypothetical protein CYG59_05200, partial [Chloroflexi bacterium]
MVWASSRCRHGSATGEFVLCRKVPALRAAALPFTPPRRRARRSSFRSRRRVSRTLLGKRTNSPMKQPDQQRATAYGGVVTHLRHSPGLRCVTYLGAAVTIQQSCGALYGAVSDLKSWTPLAMHMTAAPFVATLTWQFRNLGQPRPQDRRLLTARALRQVRAGLLLGTTAAALVVGMPALIGWTQRVEQSTTLIPLAHVMASVCYVALGNVAVTANEELVFRGYGLDVATEVVGKSVAIVGSVALFALNHGRDPMMLVGQGALGLALTALRLSSQSIWVPAGYHFAWNFML